MSVSFENGPYLKLGALTGSRSAVIASEKVLACFEAVLDTLLSGLADGALVEADSEKVMHSVADLTTAMRSDVVQNTAPTSTRAAEAIRRNSRRMEQLDDLRFEAGSPR